MWPSLFFFFSGILLSWPLFLTCFLFDLPQYSAFLVLFLQYIFLLFISSYPYFLPSSHFNLFSFIFISSFIYSLIQHILVQLLLWSRHGALYSFSWMKLRLNWFTILFILQLHTCICHCGLSQEPLSYILNYLYIEQLYSSVLLQLPVIYCTLCLNIIENNCRRKFGLVLAKVPWLLSLVVDAYAQVDLSGFYLCISSRNKLVVKEQ